MKFSHIIKNVVAIIVFALLPLSASAKCGNVDYSWGADALEGMHDYVVTMMLYVLYLTYAVEFLEIKHNAELFSKLYSKFTKSKAFAIFHYTNKILFLCQQLYHCLYYRVALSLGILLIWSKRY